MSISTGPVPPAPAKKRGMGCCGCGCGILALVVVLFVAVVAGILYFGYQSTLKLTTTAPPVIPVFSGSDDQYQSTLHKLADFDHDVKNHQAATIRLTADEINALLGKNPQFVKDNIHAYLTLTGRECRVQASVPTDAISYGYMAGRYVSVDSTFELHFDAQNKTINVIPSAIQVGDKVIAGPNAENTQASQSLLRSYTPAMNQLINSQLRQIPDGAALLDEAKTIQIDDSQLVIETQ
jgi:hypothetical protein